MRIIKTRYKTISKSKSSLTNKLREIQPKLQSVKFQWIKVCKVSCF